MAGIIHVLESEPITKKAAEEVGEKPASVEKELVKMPLMPGQIKLPLK